MTVKRVGRWIDFEKVPRCHGHCAPGQFSVSGAPATPQATQPQAAPALPQGYKTMDLPFMETVWWVFSQLHKKKLVYRGFKVFSELLLLLSLGDRPSWPTRAPQSLALV